MITSVNDGVALVREITLAKYSASDRPLTRRFEVHFNEASTWLFSPANVQHRAGIFKVSNERMYQGYY